MVKKTLVDAYKNIRKTGLIAVKLREKDELRFISITSGNDYVVMITRNGQGIVFKESDIRPMGRSAAGVMGIRLKASDEVIAMATFSQENELALKFELLTVLENGFGKRTPIIKHFPTQKRGGYGVRASKTNDKTGKVVGAIIFDNPKQDLIQVSKSGQIIRIPLKSAKLLGRDTQGVRLMRLHAGDKVASVSAVEINLPDNGQEKTEVPTKKETGRIDLKSIEVHYYDNNKNDRT